MNAFCEHHQDSVRFGYRCFDWLMLNGLIGECRKRNGDADVGDAEIALAQAARDMSRRCERRRRPSADAKRSSSPLRSQRPAVTCARAATRRASHVGRQFIVERASLVASFAARVAGMEGCRGMAATSSGSRAWSSNGRRPLQFGVIIASGREVLHERAGPWSRRSPRAVALE